jgi:hypothetical protein
MGKVLRLVNDGNQKLYAGTTTGLFEIDSAARRSAQWARVAALSRVNGRHGGAAHRRRGGRRHGRGRPVGPASRRPAAELVGGERSKPTSHEQPFS